MRPISGSVVRRAAVGTALLASMAGAGCGGDGGAAGDDASRSASPSASASSDGAGAHADGRCGGGEFETTVVKAAEGVRLTVPAEWRAESFGQGADVRLYGDDQDADDGQIVVEDEDQDIAEAVATVEKLNAYSEKTGERDLDLEGFDAAKMLTYVDDGSFTVNVVAVTEDGLGAVAYWIQEDAPEEQPTIESCLSTLRRSSGD